MCSVRPWSLALALLPLAACNPSPPMAAAPQPASAPALSAQDQQFVQMAGASDLFEIQSAQLALRETRDPSVRRFADRMIHDHTQTTQQLSSIVTAKGMTPAPALSAEQQQMMDALQGANSRVFTRQYRQDQIEGHQTAIQTFEQEANDGYDADIKGFAQQSLPLLRQHLAMAQRSR